MAKVILCPCCENELKVADDAAPSYAELVRSCDWCVEANCVAIQQLEESGVEEEQK